MKKHLEIEYKFYIDSSKLTRNGFLDFVRAHKDVVEYIYVMGPDYYVSNGSEVIRYRSSKKDKLQEITVKQRTSKNSTLIRNEIDLKLCHVKDGTVHSFLNLLKFKHEFTLIKQCDIFFMENSSGQKYTVVYYKVWNKKKPKKKYTFVEVEGDKKLKRKVSLKVVNGFKKELEELGYITKKDISKESLYEIFKRNK